MRRPARVLAAGFLIAGLAGARAQEAQVPPAGRPAPDVPSLETRIAAATVYLDRAWVTREGSVTIDTGVRSFSVRGLPAEIDDASLRIDVEGDARLEETQVHRAFLARHDEESLRTLEREIQGLRDTAQTDAESIQALQAEATFLQSIQAARGEALARALGTGQVAAPDTAAYREILSFVTDSLGEIARRRREAERRLRDVRPDLEARTRGLEEARRGARLEQKDVVVTVSAARPGPLRIRLSYVVPGALWFPAYDVRTGGDGRQAEIGYHAIVQQATGEDWRGVALTLSAARPAVRSGLPEASPWFVTLEETAVPRTGNRSSSSSTQEYAPWQNLRDQYASRAGHLQEAHARLLSNAANVERLGEMLRSDVLRQTPSAGRSSSALFPASGTETVPGDGSPRRVTIATGRLPMERRLTAVPSASADTFVTASIRNGLPHPLLPGTAHVFSGPDLVGTADIPFTAPNEPLEVFLGIDDAIKVTRALDQRRSGKTSLTGRRRIEVAYTIVAENFGRDAATLSLREPTPVSQDERVRIRLGRPTLPPASDEKGILVWTLPLAPGERFEISYEFTIEYPQDAALACLADLEGRLDER